MKYFLLTICLYAFSLTAHTQNITGTWEEYSETRFTSYTKLCIVKICDKYIGYTYDKDNDGGYCKTDLSAVFDKKRRHFLGDCVAFTINTPGHVLAIYNLYYKAKKGEEYLEGLVYEKPDSLKYFYSLRRDSTGLDSDKPEFIQLIKTSNDIDSTVYMKLMALKPCTTDPPVVVKPQLDPVPPVAIVTEKKIKKTDPDPADTPVVLSPQAVILQMQTHRVNDTIAVRSTLEKELFIYVLDDVITDGDTISIIHNGMLIAERIRVSRNPFPIKIELSKEDPYHELILVAHNLGSIPPNTALLVIRYGDEEYRLHAIADLRKNALIIFKYIGQ